jgi:hypothetical protein
VRRLVLATVVAVLALAAVAAPAATAAAKPKVAAKTRAAAKVTAAFGLVPIGKSHHGYFVYGGARGGVLRGQVQVDNYGSRPGVVKLYPADATTGQTSGTVYLTSGARPSAVGSWISLNQRELTLAPGRRWRVSFTVHVPEGATPGEHVGGIVAETVRQVAGPSSSGRTHVQIRIRNLTIVAVQVNVPGPTHAGLALGAATVGGAHGYQKLFLRLRNTGNLMVKGHGAVVVRSHAGARVLAEPLTLDTTLPGTGIALPVLVKHHALPVGSYTAHVRLVYAPLDGGTGGVVDATRRFTISPQAERQVFPSAAPLGAPAPRVVVKHAKAKPHAPVKHVAPAPAPTAAPAGVPAPGPAPQPAAQASLSGLAIGLLAGGGLFLLLAGYLVAVWRTRRVRV